MFWESGVICELPEEFWEQHGLCGQSSGESFGNGEEFGEWEFWELEVFWQPLASSCPAPLSRAALLALWAGTLPAHCDKVPEEFPRLGMSLALRLLCQDELSLFIPLPSLHCGHFGQENGFFHTPTHVSSSSWGS